jgi:hypothetical protein
MEEKLIDVCGPHPWPTRPPGPTSTSSRSPGCDSAEVGRLAAAHSIALSELIPVRASLEEAFMELTRDSVEYSKPDCSVPHPAILADAHDAALAMSGLKPSCRRADQERSPVTPAPGD